MGPSGHPTAAWMYRLEVVGLQQADTLSLVWDQCHRWQQGLGTATGHIQGRGPTSLPGHTRGHQPVPCVRSPPVPWAGLFFEALQGHGLLLPISRKGQLRPSRNALSAASTSAPQNIFPFRRGSLLAAGSAVPTVVVPVVVVPTMPLTVSSRAQGVWDGFVVGLGWVGSAGNKSGGGTERPCPTVLQGTALSPTHPLAQDVPGGCHSRTGTVPCHRAAAARVPGTGELVVVWVFLLSPCSSTYPPFFSRSSGSETFLPEGCFRWAIIK